MKTDESHMMNIETLHPHSRLVYDIILIGSVLGVS